MALSMHPDEHLLKSQGSALIRTPHRGPYEQIPHILSAPRRPSGHSEYWVISGRPTRWSVTEFR